MEAWYAARLMLSGREVAFGAFALYAMLTPAAKREVQHFMLFALQLGGCGDIGHHLRHDGFGWLLW